MVRTIDLPEYVDVDALKYDIASDGILTAQMPLHLPQKSEPPPGVVPIVTNNGRRSIRLQFRIGSDFTMDDVQVRLYKPCIVRLHVCEIVRLRFFTYVYRHFNGFYVSLFYSVTSTVLA